MAFFPNLVFYFYSELAVPLLFFLAMLWWRVMVSFLSKVVQWHLGAPNVIINLLKFILQWSIHTPPHLNLFIADHWSRSPIACVALQIIPCFSSNGPFSVSLLPWSYLDCSVGQELRISCKLQSTQPSPNKWIPGFIYSPFTTIEWFEIGNSQVTAAYTTSLVSV